ncbi:MAG: response regulator, partial [Myxococcota bacterium]
MGWSAALPVGELGRPMAVPQRARRPQEAPEASEAGSGIRIGRHDPSLNVLLVEDEPADADLVSEALRGVRDRRVFLDRAVRISDAKRRLAEGLPDLILLDLGLPDAQGLEALDGVLAAAGRVPVIVLTGASDGWLAAEAVHRGAQDFLNKDVLLEGDQLVRSIRHSLERHQLLEESWRQSQLARAAVAELRRLVHGNADGMVVIDPGGIVLFVNPAAESLLGGSADDLVGWRIPLPEGWHQHSVIDVSGGDGVVRSVELRSAPIEWNGAAARLVSLRDVSARRAAEELRTRLLHADRLRSIGQLAAGVAHEINNPAAFVTVNQESLRTHIDRLAAAFEGIQALAASWGEAPSRELERVVSELGVKEDLSAARTIVEENRSGVDRIIAIARSLRGFARVEQGHVERVSVDELIEDACLMVQNEIRHRARLHKELGGSPAITVDRGRMTQVLVNLLVNATHSIREGDVDRNRITVRTARVEDAVHLVVEDTGCGISPGDQSRIFEPFFTTKEREEGTGLGLSLSAEIVRQHRGQIRVDSQPGEGTRFTIVLPLNTGLRATHVATQAPTTSPRRDRLRILVVDDERVLLRSLSRMLGREHDVVTALGGSEGLQVLAADRGFDVILCDLMMPGVDGTEVQAWVEKNAPELRDRMVYM